MSTEAKYEELCEMIRGSSPNWTHEETLDRCAKAMDALIDLEKNYVEREQSSEVFSHSDKVMLDLFMDTDDDTEIMYLGDSYGLYGANLTISREFESRADAVEHLTESLTVVSGGKADEFTRDWIAESIQRLSNRESADFFEGNQTYSVSIESIS